MHVNVAVARPRGTVLAVPVRMATHTARSSACAVHRAPLPLPPADIVAHPAELARVLFIGTRCARCGWLLVEEQRVTVRVRRRGPLDIPWRWSLAAAWPIALFMLLGCGGEGTLADLLLVACMLGLPWLTPVFAMAWGRARATALPVRIPVCPSCRPAVALPRMVDALVVWLAGVMIHGVLVWSVMLVCVGEPRRVFTSGVAASALLLAVALLGMRTLLARACCILQFAAGVEGDGRVRLRVPSRWEGAFLRARRRAGLG